MGGCGLCWTVYAQVIVYRPTVASLNRCRVCVMFGGAVLCTQRTEIKRPARIASATNRMPVDRWQILAVPGCGSVPSVDVRWHNHSQLDPEPNERTLVPGVDCSEAALCLLVYV